MTNTVQSALSNAMVALFESSTSPEIDAEVLLSHCLRQSRAWLLAYQDEVIDDEQFEDYLELIKRRKAGEPIAYILGNREFWSLSLTVTPDTLIPRPETEILVEVALEKAEELLSSAIEDSLLAEGPVSAEGSILAEGSLLAEGSSLDIVDLGTGSGAIALSLASELKQAKITAVDASQAALDIAKHNAIKHQLHNVEFLHSNWFSGLTNKTFDLICSNPPYIESLDPHLQQGDLRFEPQTALASGIDGFFDIQAIIKEANNHLNDNGWLILEHGFEQAQRTQSLLKENGFKKIETRSDYSGHPRITFAQKQKQEILQ